MHCTPMRVGLQVTGLPQAPCDLPLYHGSWPGPRRHLSAKEYCDMCISGPGQKSIPSSFSPVACISRPP